MLGDDAVGELLRREELPLSLFSPKSVPVAPEPGVGRVSCSSFFGSGGIEAPLPFGCLRPLDDAEALVAGAEAMLVF